jgi:hypothetical protein
LPFSSMTISWSSNRFFLCGSVRACKSLFPRHSKRPDVLPPYRSDEPGFPGSSPGQSLVKPGMTAKSRTHPVCLSSSMMWV